MSATAARKVVATVLGTGGFASALYLTYHWQRMELQFQEQRERMPGDHSFVQDPARNQQYETIAPCYDARIDRDETVSGINLMRRFLLKYHATGTVLEVGAGTARNLLYYPDSVKRIVLTDSSEKMLQQAKQKVASGSSQISKKKQVVVIHADAASLDLPDAAFDTVIDTFGLCSYDDPVAVLREMARVCKPDGKVLLLEHGRSITWNFVNETLLDRHAEQHAANWGCVWNRDLDALLEEADCLELDIRRTFHFGTTYYVVCRPKRTTEKTSERRMR